MGLGTKITPTPALSESSWVICLENTPTMQEVMHACSSRNGCVLSVRLSGIFSTLYLACMPLEPRCPNNLHVYIIDSIYSIYMCMHDIISESHSHSHMIVEERLIDILYKRNEGQTGS